MKDNLLLGGVYKTEWDNQTSRIIGMDNIEVFYDCLWPHDNSWTFSGNFKKKCHFYRTSREVFERRARLINNLPLTPEEQNAFRPDLPMRLGRTRELKWNNFASSQFNEFVAMAKDLGDNKFLDSRIEINEMVLIPYGAKGGLKKGMVVKADNEKYFDCAELIWKAKELQESINDNTSEGIGIYRLGFEKGLPSFYIGEYKDSAGLLTENNLF
jgi:hypothetical protein